MLIPYKIKQIADCEKKSNEKWERKFKCSFCDKVYTDASGRRRHEKIEHISKDQKHKCKLCEKEYNSKDSMNRHIKLNHSS